MVVSECPCVGFAVNLMLGLYQGASSHYYAIIIATQLKTLNPLYKYFYLASLKAQWGGKKTLGGILRYTLGIKKIKKLDPNHCPVGLENGLCVFAMFSIEMYRKNVKNRVFHKNEQFSQPKYASKHI